MQIIYAIFLTPLIVTFLFIHELTGSMVCQYTGLEERDWQIIRVCVVIMLMSVRFTILREEVQFQFDSS
jgi:hypothetical protein